MRNVDRALSDIADIRSQLAASAAFRGFGPAVMALTGLVAILTASAQSLWPNVLMATPWSYLVSWIAAAVLCVGLIGAEMWARTRRHHGGLADAMMLNTVGHFLPAGLAGAGLMLVLLRFAPDLLWILPGVWQVLVALALFAAAKTLPRLGILPAVWLAAAWYLASGLAVLAIASPERQLAPWLMGAPFTAGQLLLAAILKFAPGPQHAEV